MKNPWVVSKTTKTTLSKKKKIVVFIGVSVLSALVGGLVVEGLGLGAGAAGADEIGTAGSLANTRLAARREVAATAQNPLVAGGRGGAAASGQNPLVAGGGGRGGAAATGQNPLVAGGGGGGGAAASGPNPLVAGGGGGGGAAVTGTNPLVANGRRTILPPLLPDSVGGTGGVFRGNFGTFEPGNAPGIFDRYSQNPFGHRRARIGGGGGGGGGGSGLSINSDVVPHGGGGGGGLSINTNVLPHGGGGGGLSINTNVIPQGVVQGPSLAQNSHAEQLTQHVFLQPPPLDIPSPLNLSELGSGGTSSSNLTRTPRYNPLGSGGETMTTQNVSLGPSPHHGGGGGGGSPHSYFSDSLGSGGSPHSYFSDSLGSGGSPNPFGF